MKFWLNAFITQLAFSGVAQASNYACDQYHSLSDKNVEHEYTSDNRTRHSVTIPWVHFEDDRWCMLFDATVANENSGIGIDFSGNKITFQPEQSMVTNNNMVSAQSTDGAVKSTKQTTSNGNTSHTYGFLQYQIDAKTGTFMIMQNTNILYTYQTDKLQKESIKNGGIDLFFRASSGEFVVKVLDPKKFPLSYKLDKELNVLKARVASLEKEKHSVKKIVPKAATKSEIQQANAQITTLKGELAGIETRYELVKNDCKKDMEALIAVENRAVLDEISVSYEHLQLQKSDYELAKSYETLMKEYQHNLNFELDLKYQNYELDTEADQLKMKIEDHKDQKSTATKAVQIDDSNTTVTTTGAAAIAVTGLAVGASACFMIFKNKETNKTGLYFDHEEKQ